MGAWKVFDGVEFISTVKKCNSNTPTIWFFGKKLSIPRKKDKNKKNKTKQKNNLPDYFVASIENINNYIINSKYISECETPLPNPRP